MAIVPGGSWSTQAPMPTPRAALGAAELNGELYAVGGSFTPSGGAQQLLATVEAYDPLANAWTTKAPMPTPRTGPAVAGGNGKLFVAGGYDGSAALKALEIYDAATNGWTQGPDMPTARNSPMAVFTNGALYVIGGGSGNTFYGTVEMYCP